MFRKGRQAFTLVELIVVITILAILGTIAFISMQSYSASARDSVRISDLGKMKTALELYNLDTGKYPETTDGFTISYSGSEVWTQGTFGESTLSNITRLDKIPLDPLTEKEFTYSVTKTRQEYQFAGIMESDGIALNSSELQVNAGDTLSTALVTGTYNGQIIKTQNGTNCSILTLPSIISSKERTETNLMNIVYSGGLVYNGYRNLPTNYISSKYKSDGGFTFFSNKFVAYNDNESCAPLYNPEDNTKRTELVENLQEAYLGTIIENEIDIKQIIDIDTTNSDEVDKMGATIINNDLGGKIAITNGDSTINVEQEIVTTYPGCNAPDITKGGITISACNLGTNISGTGVSSYGEYFQFGRNCSYQSDPINCWTDGIFAYYFDWEHNGWVDGEDDGSANYLGVEEDERSTATYANQNILDQAKMKGPCDNGYHVPTNKEWNDLRIAGGWGLNDATNMVSALKLPLAGRLDFSGANLQFEEHSGSYWSSSPYGNQAYISEFIPSAGTSVYSSNAASRSTGLPIRCFKN